MSKMISRLRNIIRKRSKSVIGFTLIECAIVTIIAGIIFASFAKGYTMYMKLAETHTVRADLETIQNALDDYLSRNGRMPCPARLDRQPNDPAFGNEQTAGAPPTCIAVPGGVFAAGGGAGQIMIGAVPVRTLNLADRYTQDPWNGRYTYAVTLTQATLGSYDEGGGKIRIEDANGNNVLEVADTANYIVASHGPDRAGAYSNDGALGVACAGGTLDGENCNNDTRFIKAARTSTAPGAAHYDDFLIFPSSAKVKNLQITCGDRGMLYGPNHPQADPAGSCLPGFRIMDSGNVGFGTSVDLRPTDKMQVSSTRLNGYAAIFRQTNNLSSNGISVTTQTVDSMDFSFYTAANDVLNKIFTIRATGKVNVGPEGIDPPPPTPPRPPLYLDNWGLLNVEDSRWNTYAMYVKANPAHDNGMLIDVGTGAGMTDNGLLIETVGFGVVMRVWTAGRVGIGTDAPNAALDVIGQIRATGFLSPSDIRLKKDIVTLEGATEKLEQLRGVTYNWLKEDMPKERQMGVIAQEVEKVFPEAVATHDNGFKSVNYDALVAPLIESIKERKNEIDALKKEVAILKAGKK